jgi:hypothetical protein
LDGVPRATTARAATDGLLFALPRTLPLARKLGIAGWELGDIAVPTTHVPGRTDKILAEEEPMGAKAKPS